MRIRFIKKELKEELDFFNEDYNKKYKLKETQLTELWGFKKKEPVKWIDRDYSATPESNTDFVPTSYELSAAKKYLAFFKTHNIPPSEYYKYTRHAASYALGLPSLDKATRVFLKQFMSTHGVGDTTSKSRVDSIPIPIVKNARDQLKINNLFDTLDYIHRKGMFIPGVVDYYSVETPHISKDAQAGTYDVTKPRGAYRTSTTSAFKDILYQNKSIKGFQKGADFQDGAFSPSSDYSGNYITLDPSANTWMTGHEGGHSVQDERYSEFGGDIAGAALDLQKRGYISKATDKISPWMAVFQARQLFTGFGDNTGDDRALRRLGLGIRALSEKLDDKTLSPIQRKKIERMLKVLNKERENPLTREGHILFTRATRFILYKSGLVPNTRQYGDSHGSSYMRAVELLDALNPRYKNGVDTKTGKPVTISGREKAKPMFRKKRGAILRRLKTGRRSLKNVSKTKPTWSSDSVNKPRVRKLNVKIPNRNAGVRQRLNALRTKISSINPRK